MNFGVNLSFAIKRWPEPAVWARIVRETLGLNLVQFTYDLLDPWWPDSIRRAMTADVRKVAEDWGIDTNTDATTGAFASQSVITLHPDGSMQVIDSGQEGAGVPFSSQQGVWEHAPRGGLAARTLDFSFPFATQGSARVDWRFNSGVPANQVSGTSTLTLFPPNGNPLDGGGTVAGTFNFTGTRVTVP